MSLCEAVFRDVVCAMPRGHAGSHIGGGYEWTIPLVARSVADARDAALDLAKARLERMNLKGGLGHDVHAWIDEVLAAIDALPGRGGK